MTDPISKTHQSLSLVERGSASTSVTVGAHCPAPVPEHNHPNTAPHIPKYERHWDAARMVTFLEALGATQSVAGAARAAGMSRQSAYRLRQRLRDTHFDLAWEVAFHHGFDQLAQAALDRAINGVEVPHYHGGELVGTSRRYNERLTMAMLANRSRAAPDRFGGMMNEWAGDWDGLLERVEADGPDGNAGAGNEGAGNEGAGNEEAGDASIGDIEDDTASETSAPDLTTRANV
ncbi:hypothetical protein GCM10023115_09920 [Pontixanthobacter gangjinensis]|uniref:LysR family transcriptional regulator n=1 Tax=Pontixanthobacter gangjinensis TaxID=1028742 RepID=A0A6I4SLD2_9SPHN|nr:hypothetical protein [Pontixanthobacter gangjinensis]MXO56238.1 hypothetical protein [Pontixanthobacter gangjinensis]